MEKCRDIMTENPSCCLPSDPVSRAAQLMKSEDVGSVPIVQDEQSKRLVGIVTDRDLTLKIIAEGRDATSTRIEEVMTRDLVICRADDDVGEAMEAMAEHQLRRIPIVENGNRLIGIIAQADVATRVDEPKKTGKVVEKISQP